WRHAGDVGHQFAEPSRLRPQIPNYVRSPGPTQELHTHRDRAFFRGWRHFAFPTFNRHRISFVVTLSTFQMVSTKCTYQWKSYNTMKVQSSRMEPIADIPVPTF